jgi:hypothetical protein
LAYRFHIFLFDSKLDSLYATAGARLCTSASTGFPSMLRKSGRRATPKGWLVALKSFHVGRPGGGW